MPLSAIKKVATAQNGVGAFLLQCKRMDFHYCNWWGSSRGMNAFIKSSLPAFVKRNPSIEFHISPQPRQHPTITAHYLNGAQRTINVRNLEAGEVRGKAELLRNSTGVKNKKLGKPVESRNESVRGIWDPFHGAKIKL